MKLGTMVTSIEKFDASSFDSDDIGIEVQTFPQDIMDEDHRSLIELWKTKLDGFGGYIAMHGSSFDLHPGSLDLRVKQVCMYRYMESIHLANDLGATYVVFHSQVNPLLSVEGIKKKKLDMQVMFWKELISDLPDGLTILLENEYDSNAESLKYLIDKIDSDRFGVCLDTGHALAYSDIELWNWFEALGNRIKYVHLHYNDGSKDSHNRPTDGQLDEFRILYESVLIDVPVTIEYRVDHLKDEFQRLRRRLTDDIK